MDSLMNNRVAAGGAESAPAIDWGGDADDWGVEPMKKSRLLELLEAGNPCGMQFCTCETDVRPARSLADAAARLAMAAMFALVQGTTGYSAAGVSHEDYTASLRPDYPAFVSLVRQYQWHSGVRGLGFQSASGDFRLVMLESEIMTHAARPGNFSMSDIGGFSCLPGKGGFPGNAGEACHAVLPSRRKNDETGTPGLDNL